MPSIITMLTTEHREVAKLFAILAKTTARSEQKRREVFAELDQALSKHADFEEAEVYPLVEAQKSSKALAQEAVEEHAQIKHLLAELRSLDAADERWLAKLTVLQEDVEHHVKEEEGELFKELRTAAEAKELEQIGADYAAVKAEKMATPSKRGAATA